MTNRIAMLLSLTLAGLLVSCGQQATESDTSARAEYDNVVSHLRTTFTKSTPVGKALNGVQLKKTYNCVMLDAVGKYTNRLPFTVRFTKFADLVQVDYDYDLVEPTTVYGTFQNGQLVSQIKRSPWWIPTHFFDVYYRVSEDGYLVMEWTAALTDSLFIRSSPTNYFWDKVKAGTDPALSAEDRGTVVMAYCE